MWGKWPPLSGIFAGIRIRAFSPMNRSFSLFSRRTPVLRAFSDMNVPTPQIQKTALNEVHKQMGGKMVEFCGWELPVQYEAGVLKEHIACRTQAALFDVSHMGQLRYSALILRITGPQRVSFIERLVVSDIAKLPLANSKLTVMTNPEGGIIDDTMISNHGEFLYQVTKACPLYSGYQCWVRDEGSGPLGAKACGI